MNKSITFSEYQYDIVGGYVMVSIQIDNNFNYKGYEYYPDRLVFIKHDKFELLKSEVDIFYPSDPTAHLEIDLKKYNANCIRIGRGPITQCGICLTNKCQLNCTYCSNSSSPNRLETLNIKQVKDFVSEIIFLYNKSPHKEPLRFSFTGGGEPTYDWELFTKSVGLIKDHCSSSNIKFELFLTTNGVLTDEKRNFICENFDNIMISYDGSSERNYMNRPFFNGNDPTTIVESTIDYLIKRNVKFSVRSTIWMYDIENLRHYSDWIITRFGNITWTINLVMPSGRAKTPIDKNFSPEDIVRTYLSVFRGRNQRLSRYTDCSTFSRDVVPLMCGGIMPLCSNLWLKPDGKIVTCIEECEQTELGTVGEDGVEYNEVCSDKLLRTIQTNLTACKRCIAYRFCKGGCPARHEIYEELNINNRECILIQYYWEQVFKSMIDREPFFDMHVCESKYFGADVLEIITTKDGTLYDS